MRTMRLPDGPTTIEGYVDFVADQVGDLDGFVLVGDSFGANVALGLAVRRPPGLRGLVMSGGFATDPVTSPVDRLAYAMVPLLRGPLYRQLTLRLHARNLASPHDGEGQLPWSGAASRRLFLDSTPAAAFVRRTRVALTTDYVDDLSRVAVPTLILTPSHDTLIGPDAAAIMRNGIPDATEVILDRTGHMFRFSHPVSYGRAIEDFLLARVDGTGTGTVASGAGAGTAGR